MKSLLPKLFLSLVALSGPPLLAQAVAPVLAVYAPPSHKNVLGTTFVDWDSLYVRITPVGQQRAVFDNPTPTLEKFEVHVTTLRPGAFSHPVHHHPWEEMLLIKEGHLEVYINGKTYQATPGCLVFFASYDPHNARNVGDTPATYYVINFYTGLEHTVPATPAIEQALPGMLPSGVIDCDSLPTTPTKTGSRVSVVSSPTITFRRLESHITTLNPGQSTLPDMIDSGDELFVLKTGTLEASTGGVTVRLKEGSIFYFAPNDKRTFKNIGMTPATYHVIKVVSDKTPKTAT
jgi:XRE family transcriptional regulator, regulator of sulfur utilization